MIEKDALTAFVAKEKVRLLYMQAPVSNVVNIVFAVAIYFFVQGPQAGLFASAWVITLILFALVRFWVWRQYKLRPESRSSQAWLNEYTLFSSLIGLAWAGAYLHAPDPLGPAQLTWLAMLYFGTSTAAYTALSIHLPSLVGYTLPSMLAFSHLLYRQPDPSLSLLMVAFWLYYITILMFARNDNKRQLKAFQLEAHNDQLVEALQHEVSAREEQIERKTQQLRESKEALEQSEEQLQNVISGANLGFWDWDYQSGHHQVNNRWLEILGLGREDIQNDVTDWSDRVHPDDRQRMELIVNQSIATRSPFVGEFRMRHKNGNWVWIQGSGSVVEYDDNGMALRLCGTHQEISDRKSLEQQLAYQASHDALTGLLNRRELWERLEVELSRAERHSRQLVIFLLDIDHFKTINDSLGHKAGDLVLQGLSTLLDSQLRKMDLCGRYGGEEFVVALPETTITEAVGMAERLRSLVENNERLAKGVRMSITVSIGIAAYPPHGTTVAELIESADKALYRAKDLGRNRIESA